MSAEATCGSEGGTDASTGAIRPKSQPQRDYCSLDNEAARAFLPIIGQSAFALYVTLAINAVGKSRFDSTQRQLASETGQSLSSVSRNLTILVRIGMVRVFPSGGSMATTYELTDLKELCSHYGATERRGPSLALPAEVTERLKGELAALRSQLAGKRSSPVVGSARQREKVAVDSHQRDASVSPERRQRFTGGTQMGADQLRKKEEEKNSPSPTPSRSGEREQNQTLSTNDKASDELLKRARDCFTGVMDGLRNHLLNPARPPLPHLADGLDDWRTFEFDSFKVEGAKERAGGLDLTISAEDPGAAAAGIKKYRRTWDAQTHRWFGHDVRVSFVSKPAMQPGGGRGV